MGSVRLAIIDPEGGRQPFESDVAALVFNGEIYNYVELTKEFSADGYRFRTRSDTEVLFAVLGDGGARSLEKLNGIFAFAHYDRHDRRLLLARDRLGVKPLYYCHHPGNFFAFASEPKALLALPFVKARPDWDAIREYLFLQLVLEDKTFHSGIRRLSPGHLLEFSCAEPAGAGPRPYWTIPLDHVREPSNEAGFADELERLLLDAMTIQMRSDAPVGATLSGGLDSSLVAALAARFGSVATPAFSGRFFDDLDYDEGLFIGEVLRNAPGLEGVDVAIAPSDFSRLAERMIHVMDYPEAGPGLFSQMRVAEAAAGRVKVLLGGQGGDELFGGYVRYLIAYLEFAIKGGISGDAGEGTRYAVTLPDLVHSLPQLENYVPLLRRFWSANFMGDSTMRYWDLIDRSPSSEFIAGDFLASDEARVRSLFRASFEAPRLGSFFNRMTHWDLRHFLPALLHVEDRSTMAFSLESRVPLLDHRIVEFVFQVPPVVKFRRGRLKHLYRLAVEKHLPERVCQRRDKKGFPIPFAEWFARDERLREHVRERIVESEFLAPIIDRDAVAAKILSAGRYDRTWWAFYNLAEWGRIHCAA